MDGDRKKFLTIPIWSSIMLNERLKNEISAKLEGNKNSDGKYKFTSFDRYTQQSIQLLKIGMFGGLPAASLWITVKSYCRFSKKGVRLFGGIGKNEGSISIGHSPPVQSENGHLVATLRQRNKKLVTLLYRIV